MKKLNHPKTLLIGIGNSGRSDDGLGWAFVEAIEEAGSFLGNTLLRYQLQVEDAELLSRYEQVIFVDAFQGELGKGFGFKKCLPAKDFSFTTHRLPPETVLYLCQELYAKTIDAFLLVINGEKWELDIGLSEMAGNNLKRALAFFDEKILSNAFAET
ncbi:MAG: hydrogenase maturation protease [Bacteroidota bacterium]